METYIVRTVATLRLVGVFAAKNSTHLFQLVDQDRDPFTCEYLALQGGEGLLMDALFTGTMCDDGVSNRKALRVNIEAVPHPAGPQFTDTLAARLNRGRSWNSFKTAHFEGGFNLPLGALVSAAIAREAP